MNGKRIPHTCNSRRDQSTGFPGEFQNTLPAFLDPISRRFRQVEQHHDRQIAVFHGMSHGDPRVRCLTTPDGDHGVDRRIQIDIVAIFQIPLTSNPFRLQQIDDLSNLCRNGTMSRQDLVNLTSQSHWLPPFMHGCPVRT